jgi:protein-S-isoprenylcysteine O-methyltransferase Ste14
MSENKDHPDIKILPPFLMLIHLIVAFTLKWMIPLSTPAPQVVKVIGWMILAGGFLFAIGALRELNKADTSPIPHEPTTAIVTSGVYRFSRNPIYVGFVCTVIGLPLALGNYWGLILSPAMIYYFNELIIKHEEAYLEKKFGDVYTSYKSRVRRWL